MNEHGLLITIAFFAIPIGGAFLVWDTMPTKDEEDDL